MCARALAVAEYLAAVVLLLVPVRWPAVLPAGLLFAGFAVVGAHQLLSRSEVACGCLGTMSQRVVGWPQVIQLVPVAALLWLSASSDAASVTDGLAVAVASQIVACILIGWTAATDIAAVRQQRISLTESAQAVL